MTNLADKIKTRPLNPETDLNFILSTWLKSYRQSHFAVHIPNDIYYSQHQGIIKQILVNPNNTVTILCSIEDPDQILGYIVYSLKDPIIFYTYIKHSFRKMNLAQVLFKGVTDYFNRENPEKVKPVICTHKCRRWSQAAKKFNLIYNPYTTGS